MGEGGGGEENVEQSTANSNCVGTVWFEGMIEWGQNQIRKNPSAKI